MGYNHSKNWFEYNGKYYGSGTVVKIKPEIYQNLQSVKKCGGILKFVSGTTNGWMYFNNTYGKESEHRAGIADFYRPKDIIEKIITPVYVELEPIWKTAANNYNRRDDKYNHLAFTGTTIYVFVMAFGTLFYARWLIYIVATIIYLIYWVNKYRN